ncbi:MAG: glucosidase [Pirellulaceae bacterium]
MKTKTAKSRIVTASKPMDADLKHTATTEEMRLAESANRTAHWQRWGPYLSERQWGTVREDYSEHGNCWDYFSHDQSRSRAYRWGEDGLLGICDRQCRLCFSVALWNGRDPILKERLFGLTGPEGNHGEDVKECYYYLDATPTHSYLKALYKYPQAEFPYARLAEENRRRGKLDSEFELIDSGAFDDNRYFDVFAEYAQNSPDDILIRLTVANRGPETATVHLLPTLWFRNTWSWGCTHEGCEVKPRLERSDSGGSAKPFASVRATHPSLGNHWFMIDSDDSGAVPELLFTENETNTERLFNHPGTTPFVKDAFHRHVIHGEQTAVNPNCVGTKTAAHFRLEIPAGKSVVVRLRLTAERKKAVEPFGDQFESLFETRIRETDEFYDRKILANRNLDAEQRNVARQAYAGLLWSKQFYHMVVKNWIEGDADQPAPPANRRNGRNHDWPHLFNRDIISMPDKWEYPWYAAWDLAFHMIPMARLDPEFAKGQLELLLREWYMHPNGQIPAYEFAFSDVNPPVHAWACWRVYKITGNRGNRDRKFLARVFTKLMLNFTWWVNRKDVSGNHLFSGGFLGLDNIGVFDRSKPLPGGGQLEQADGTAWMAFYCATMLSMALELAKEDPTYEDIASKFFEHFVHIADAINTLGGSGLWNETDGFYYDQLRSGDQSMALPIRSIVGVIPLFAVEILEQSVIDKLPGFKKRMDWFLKNRPDLAGMISWCACSDHDSHSHHHAGDSEKNGRHNGSASGNSEKHQHDHRLLAIPSRERLESVLRYVLDENEFLSPYGVRALSRHHQDNPFVMEASGEQHRVDYVPGESNSGLFGGNSNWRGPVWFPVNFLLVEALERYHHFYGENLTVEFPRGSGSQLNLMQVAQELSGRLAGIFLPDENGRRACHAADSRYANDEHWRDLVLFYEYFHGDTGRGVGASHQTGWTALVTELLRG